MNNPMNGNAPIVRLDAEVTFTSHLAGGRTRIVAHHPATEKFFQLGSQEYRVAKLLDGQRTPAEIVETLTQEGSDWTAEDLTQFITQLVKANLVIVSKPLAPDPGRVAAAYPLPDDPNSADAATSMKSASEIPSSEQSAESRPPENRLGFRFAWLSLLISQRIPLLRGDRIATALEHRCGALFDFLGLMVWLGLVSTGILVVYGHWNDFADELRRMFDPALWPMLVLLWVISKIIHEAGHAICAKHHGVKVGSVGIMFFFLAPLAYVDVTDAWRLRSRFQRVQIALGGVYLELAVASLAAWAWWWLGDGYLKHLAAQFFLIAGPASILVNANPLLRLDGYYVVSDLTDIPNLRMHGRQLLGGWLQRVVIGIPQSRTLLNGWRVPFAAVHAAASVVFQFFWMGGLILGVAAWAKGLGIFLAGTALLLWFIVPLVRWLHKVWTYAPAARFGMNPYRRRLIGVTTMLLMILQHLGTYNSPLDRRVAVVVRFHNEQIARSPRDAFVQSVHVHHGDYVETGRLLVELSDPELSLQRHSLADDLEIAEMQSVQMRRQGDLSKAAMYAENADSLRRQLAELDAQLAEMSVVALRDGYVIGIQVESLWGRFVASGTELLRVCDPKEKEILAAVRETDVEAFNKAAQSQLVSDVRLRGGARIQTTPIGLRPRASRTLMHPSLSAVVGGPLSVEPVPGNAQDFRLVQPHFQSITPLDLLSSTKVRAGQIGSMAINDDRPILKRAADAIEQQLRSPRM